MKFSNQGLTLWYGTPDAPAPMDNAEQPRQGNTIVVAVQPAAPGNRVDVKYRVDGGPVKAVPAARFRTDFAKRIDYFRATLPHFSTGDKVSYLPVVNGIAGRVPGGDMSHVFPAVFRLGAQSMKYLRHTDPLVA